MEKALLIILILFWAIYLTRIIYYTTSTEVGILNNPSHYWIWGVGTSFLPMVGLSLSRIDMDGQALVSLCSRFVLIIAILAMSQSATSSAFDGVDADYRRLDLESLNPISLGRLGAVLIILTIWRYVFPRPDDKNSRFIFAGTAMFSIFVGTYLLIQSGSRGPQVALVAMLLFLLFCSSFRQAFFLTVMVTIIVVVSVIVLQATSETRVDFLINRVSAVFQGGDTATSTRLLSYSGAWEVFKSHPFFGYGFEEPNTNYYPHNAILEAFMSTGIFGGSAFLCVIFFGFLLAIKHIKQRSGFGWCGLLFVGYFTQILFSGSLYQASEFWGILGFLVSLSYPRALAKATE